MTKRVGAPHRRLFHFRWASRGLTNRPFRYESFEEDKEDDDDVDHYESIDTKKAAVDVSLPSPPTATSTDKVSRWRDDERFTASENVTLIHRSSLEKSSAHAEKRHAHTPRDHNNSSKLFLSPLFERNHTDETISLEKSSHNPSFFRGLDPPQVIEGEKTVLRGSDPPQITGDDEYREPTVDNDPVIHSMQTGEEREPPETTICRRGENPDEVEHASLNDESTGTQSLPLDDHSILEENLKEENPTLTLDASDYSDSECSSHMGLPRDERPLLKDSRAVKCTCHSKHRKRSPSTDNTKIVWLSNHPKVIPVARQRSLFSWFTYESMDLTKNKDAQKVMSRGVLVEPHRRNRGTFAEATKPPKDGKCGKTLDIQDEMDELDDLVYSMDPLSLYNMEPESLDQSMRQLKMPVDSELSAIAEESEDLSRSQSKSTVPTVPSLNKTQKLAQYLKRDGEASSAYIGAMYFNANSSEDMHSELDYSGYFSLEDALEPDIPSSFPQQTKRPNDFPPPETPSDKKKTSGAEPGKEDEEETKETKPKDESSKLERTRIPYRREFVLEGDEILLRTPSDDSSGAISDITEKDFLKIPESSPLFKRAIQIFKEDNEEEYEMIHDIVELERPVQHILSEEEESGFSDLNHLVTIDL